jgi:two-component system, OmpR family, phosphate regulon sensor histidine kinase PhoR
MKYPKTKEGEQMYANNFSDLLSEFDANIAEWVHRKAEEIDVLKSNEAYRKEYIGNVSHELKTPLFNIQGYIDTLIDGGLRDDEINMKYLKRTEKNINRLIAIVKDLETISKLETGQHALEINSFDIVQLIQEVFDMHEIRAKRKKIELKFDKSYASPILVNADKKGILNVVGNLIINSIIYGKDHGFTIVGIQTYRNKISVSISDNGIGIEARHLKRIFERFFRVDKSRSKFRVEPDWDSPL